MTRCLYLSIRIQFDKGLESLKLDYPATARNREAILQVLRKIVEPGSKVLEIASGSGQHAAYFTAAMPSVVWQPTDVNPEALASIDAYRKEAEQGNFLLPIELDICEKITSPKPYDLVVAINLLHISPKKSLKSLFHHSQNSFLAKRVYVYGPFIEQGVETAPSNVEFDLSLRQRDSQWGLRSVDNVSDIALACGFELDERISMPANNLSLVFRRV